MRQRNSYKRVRGQSSVSQQTRKGFAKDYKDQAQLEDLLDLLSHEIGVSRTSVISNPNRMLTAITGEKDTPTTEKIWSRDWAKLSERVHSCLDNGGAAALSFKHKGSRSSGTHIVSILKAEEDGFVVDDPYGVIREDYNPRGWDDAYWSKNDDGKLIGSRDRSNQKNESGERDDWGVSWARNLPKEERRGQESVISRKQVERSMFYVQLFHRADGSESQLTQPRRGPRID